MGCHTWAYAPVEPITYQAKLSIVDAYLTKLSNYSSPLLRKYVRRVRRLNLHPSTVHKLYLNSIELPFEHQGQLYHEVGYHDMFRVPDYPDTVLTTRECTLRYVANLDADLDRINQFWDDHPDGLINFG